MYEKFVENSEPTPQEIEKQKILVDMWLNETILENIENVDEKLLEIRNYSFFNYYHTLQQLCLRPSRTHQFLQILNHAPQIMENLPESSLNTLACCSRGIYKEIKSFQNSGHDYPGKHIIYNKQEFKFNILFINSLIKRYEKGQQI